MTVYNTSIIPRKEKPCKMDQIRQLLPPEADEELIMLASNPTTRTTEIQDLLRRYEIVTSPIAITFWRNREFSNGKLAMKINEEVKDYRGIDSFGVLDKLVYESMENLILLREKMQTCLNNDEMKPDEILRHTHYYERNLLQAIESKEKMHSEAQAKDYTLAGATFLLNFLMDAAGRDNPGIIEFLAEAGALALMAIKTDRVA